MSDETKPPETPPYWKEVSVLRFGDLTTHTFEHALPTGGLLILVRSVVGGSGGALVQTITNVPPQPFNFGTVAGGNGGVYR